MRNKKSRVRIELTEDQKRKIKETSGEDISVIEFTVPELEDASNRAPRTGSRRSP